MMHHSNDLYKLVIQAIKNDLSTKDPVHICLGERFGWLTVWVVNSLLVCSLGGVQFGPLGGERFGWLLTFRFGNVV